MKLIKKWNVRLWSCSWVNVQFIAIVTYLWLVTKYLEFLRT